MRALSHNKPADATDVWVKALNDNGKELTVTFENDPASPTRGRTVFSDDEAAIGGTTMRYRQRGYAEFSVRVNVPPPGTQQEGPSLEFVAGGVDPFSLPTEVLLAFRGSIWTARAAISHGPRPGDASNICAMDYLADTNVFTEDEARTMLQAYLGVRRYRHYPSGPDVAAGYHDQYPAVDIRADVDGWVRRHQAAYNAGGIPVHFLCPDGWSLDDCKRELEPIYRRPEVNRLVRLTVPRGWEPNGADGGYNISNEEWCAFIRWSMEVFPNAIPGIHMIADFDAPIGHDVPPPNVDAKTWAWQNCYNAGARFFLDQIGGYLNTGPGLDPFFLSELAKRITYFRSHFAAWGMPDMRYVFGEYGAYNAYWENWPEADVVALGDFAMANGAQGFFDGGTPT